MDNKEEIKKSLNGWFKKQNRFKTKKEFSTELGIPNSTVKKYFSQGRIPVPQNREKLYRVTKLKCFEPEERKSTESVSVHIEPEVEKPISFPPKTMVQMIVPTLDNLLKKIGDDIAQRNKIKASLQRIMEAWSKDNFDAANRIISPR